MRVANTLLLRLSTLKTILAAIQKGIILNGETEVAFAAATHESLKLATWGTADLTVVGRLSQETVFRILNPQSRYGLSCAGALQEHEAKKPNLRGFEGLTKAETPILEACTRPGNKPKNPILGG